MAETMIRESQILSAINHRSGRSEGVVVPCGAGNGHSSGDADGLGGFRGLRSALIIEALAGGLVWAAWYFAPRIAAWWGAR